MTLVRGEPTTRACRRASVDAAILVHMYHEIAQPFAFLYNLVPALRPGARVGIVDLDRPIGSTARGRTSCAANLPLWAMRR